ncbi:hypothetical protein [Saliterribacillus persicus]|uniref:DUF3278 domain-containing protein n=1 Tax=Saliterribacillus persicus TaxID=930114 RepID=A0A368X7W6_9BACI|nr:hypothetical protein [Saliterribacillus persicus]RCW63078.1 hypothetical protein DFR57_12059 [Saliterribacillus persicus]
MKNQVLNRFIGVVDDRDEYQRYEIYKQLAYSGILLWYLSMLLMFINLIIDTIQNTLSFATPSLFIINMGYAIMAIVKIRKKDLDEIDCASTEEYIEKKKALKKASSLAGFQFGLFMLIFIEFVSPYLVAGEIDVRWWNILIWIFSGLFFGIIMYWFSKSKLQKHF